MSDADMEVELLEARQDSPRQTRTSRASAVEGGIGRVDDETKESAPNRADEESNDGVASDLQN